MKYEIRKMSPFRLLSIFIIPFIEGKNRPLAIAIGSLVKKPGIINSETKIREFLSMTVQINHDLIVGTPAVDRNVNGTVKNSPEMVQCIVAAAERAGIPFKMKPATLGTVNDSGPFSKAGLKALTIHKFWISDAERVFQLCGLRKI